MGKGMGKGIVGAGPRLFPLPFPFHIPPFWLSLFPFPHSLFPLHSTYPALRRAVIPAFVNPDAGHAADVDKALRSAGCFDVRAVAATEVTRAVRAAVDAGATRVAAVAQ